MNRLPPVPPLSPFEKFLGLVVWGTIPFSPVICIGCLLVAYIWTHQ